MIKHTKTMRPLLSAFLSVFDHFVGLALKGLRVKNSFNSFMHNVEKWPNFKSLAVFTRRDFYGMLDYFPISCMKGLRENHNYY